MAGGLVPRLRLLPGFYGEMAQLEIRTPMLAYDRSSVDTALQLEHAAADPCCEPYLPMIIHGQSPRT
jgi:hypothetical protein